MLPILLRAARTSGRAVLMDDGVAFLVHGVVALFHLAFRIPLRAAALIAGGRPILQTSAKGAAGQLRKDRDAMVREIIEGRMQIQFAADAEWPFTDPANHPIRMQFQLPASRPFVG